MSWRPPDYLSVKADQLGQGASVKVRIGGDQQQIAEDFARAILAVIQECAAAQKATTLILPVGPVDQFPILAALINEQKVDCRELVIINMDEYLADKDQWVPLDHPLSFRG